VEHLGLGGGDSGVGGNGSATLRQRRPVADRAPMTSRQLHVGQTVYLRPPAARNVAAGAYEIRAVLPDEGGQRRYRIKSLIEPHERVVSEQELSET
jgi:hypothetical protein